MAHAANNTGVEYAREELKLLLPHVVTERQREYIEAVITHGSARKAAEALGVGHQNISRVVAAARKRASMHGWQATDNNDAPMIEVPNPYVIRGTSTLYGPDGEKKLSWVKTRLDESKAREAIEEWVQWLASDVQPAPAVAVPVNTFEDLLTVYPMGDPHFGMYAWAKEAGDDFDLDIAERLTYGAIDRLVEAAPASDEALIAELGDFFHSDNNSARTERSGNALDVDTRWPRVMQIGLRAMIYVCKATLKKHKRVTVRIVAGNHDPHSSYALALALDAYFRDEPRIQIELSPAQYWFYRFGKVLIGLTHGDMTKPVNLPGIMANDRSVDWGETTFRYFYHGHIHHDSQKEYPGVMIESFRTLAAKDAWHAAAGYRSGRDMKCIVHHRQYGEIERHRCDVAMLNLK